MATDKSNANVGVTGSSGTGGQAATNERQKHMHITKAELQTQSIEALPAREIPFVFSWGSVVGSFNSNTAMGLNLGTVGSANFVSANQLIVIG